MEANLSRRDTLALFLALGVPAGAAHPEEHGASGLTARVTFENDRVRVLEYLSAGGSPACGAGRHFHPAHLTIYLTPVRVRGHKDDGTTVEADRKAGEVAWAGPAKHKEENLNTVPFKVAVVELK